MKLARKYPNIARFSHRQQESFLCIDITLMLPIHIPTLPMSLKVFSLETYSTQPWRNLSWQEMMDIVHVVILEALVIYLYAWACPRPCSFHVQWLVNLQPHNRPGRFVYSWRRHFIWAPLEHINTWLVYWWQIPGRIWPSALWICRTVYPWI